MEKKDPQLPERKPWVKPELFCYPLRPEEAVLGYCKTAGRGGPNTLSGCGGIAARCSALGS